MTCILSTKLRLLFSSSFLLLSSTSPLYIAGRGRTYEYLQQCLQRHNHVRRTLAGIYKRKKKEKKERKKEKQIFRMQLISS